MRWLAALGLGLGLLTACKKQSEAPPPPPGPTMPASEIKRAHDACQTYVDKVCGCAKTTPAMQEPCSKARPLLEAIDVAIDVAAGSDSTRRDVRQSEGSVRNIVKECIEQAAKLPAAGCP